MLNKNLLKQCLGPHPPLPALMQPHWLSVCLVFPKFISTSGPLHRHTGARTPARVLPVRIHHVHMYRLSTPKALNVPAQPSGITLTHSWGSRLVRRSHKRSGHRTGGTLWGPLASAPAYLGVGTAHVCAKWSLDSLSQGLHRGTLVLAPFS